jgi:hypothetical protein
VEVNHNLRFIDDLLAEEELDVGAGANTPTVEEEVDVVRVRVEREVHLPGEVPDILEALLAIYHNLEQGLGRDELSERYLLGCFPDELGLTY